MKKLVFIILCLLCYLPAISQDYLQEAITCFEQGDYECAKKNYTLFQTLDGKDMGVQITLVEECLRTRIVADGYFEDKDYKKARDRYKLLLEKNPQDPVAIKQYNECGNKLAEERQRVTELQQQEKQQERQNEQNPPITTHITSDHLVIDEISHYLVYVEGGAFMMGCNDKSASKAEKPAHQVTVSSFMIGKYPVTQREWQAVMGSNPSYFIGDDLPVEHVSWNDVQEFLKKLNKLTGKEYRLPTEAEWEYAARGGNSSRGYKYAGSNNIDDIAWYTQNSGVKTHQVGLKRANELRLYDMSGNVWEWCSDWYGNYSAGALTNPRGPSIGTSHVLRGGNWYARAVDCRSTYRRNTTTDSASQGIGFRLAVSL